MLVNTLLLFYIVFSAGFIAVAQTIGLCTTPGGETGECVMIHQCPSLFEINQKLEKTTNERNLLTESHCGSIAHVFPKVCCLLEKCSKSETYMLLPQDKQACGISKKAEIGAYPWSTLIEYENTEGQRLFECAGLLINDKYIIVPAHCAYNLKNKKIVGVRLGEHNTSTDPDCNPTNHSQCLNSPLNRQIAEIIVHESYTPFAHRDNIALLRLKQPVNFSETSHQIHPICLPLESRHFDYQGKVLELSGWERIRGFHFVKNDGVEALVWPHNKCQAHFNQIKVGETRHLCASQRNESDKYPGDIGGVLVAPSDDERGYAAVGLLTRGVSEWEMGAKGPQARLYTRIGDYLVWLLGKMEQ